MRYLKLLLLFCVLSTKAQNVTLTWAEKIKTRGQASVLGGKNGLYYTTHTDKDDQLVVRTYNQKMDFKNEQVVSFNLEDKKYAYEGAYFVNDQIIHFIKETKRKEDKVFLYAGTTNLNLKTSDKINILDEADTKNLIYFGARSISPDSTKILTYTEVEGKRKEPNTLNFKVYKSDLSDIILDKAAQLPIKSKNYSTETFEVDNFGNVYVLARIIKERDEREKDRTKFYYKLIVFGIDGSTKEFDFDYETKDIESIDLIAGKNNTIICSGFLKTLGKGFLGNNKKTLISDELFTSVIDCQTLTLKSATKYELEGLYPEKLKSGDYVPYKVRKIFDKEDGGHVIVAEQYKLVIVQTQKSTYYRYYYCDIAIIHTNNKSEVVSVSKMPKYQLNASNPSIISTYKNGNTYIIYEDLAKNLNAEGDKDTKRSSGSSGSNDALFLLTVLPSGEMKKEIIYSYKESKIKPYLSISRVIAPGEIVLNANDQIGVLKIN